MGVSIGGDFEIRGEDGFLIARLPSEGADTAERKERRANAEFIVRVCNSALQMLAALKRAEKFFSGGLLSAGFNPTASEEEAYLFKRCEAEINSMRDAIALAEKRT